MRATKDLKDIVADVRGGNRKSGSQIDVNRASRYNTTAQRIDEELDEQYNF